MTLFEEVSPDMLVDVSYTISYSIDGKSWDSFHSYLPDKLFNSRNNLYSVNDGKIYKHNADNKCIFYNGIEKCSISPVFKTDKNQFLLNSIYLETDVLNEQGIRISKTFNRIRIVDSYQGTNTIELVPFDETKTAYENYDVANTRRIKNGWFFNKFRDEKANEFVNNVREQIDKFVFNNINITNLAEGVRRFNDNYVMFIIEYDNAEQNDFYIYSIDINANPTKR